MKEIEFYSKLLKICDAWIITKIDGETCILCFFEDNKWWNTRCCDEPRIYIPHDISMKILHSMCNSPEGGEE